MDILLVLPILIPFYTAIFCIFAWRHRQIQRVLAIMGSTGLFFISLVLLMTIQRDGIQSTYIGDWPVPFAIVIVADLFSAIMVAVSSLIGMCVVIFSLASVDEHRRSFGYYPLVLILLMGASGVFLTGDLFNLYVWFEVTLITSFVLMVLGGERSQMEGAIKYFSLNLLVSAFFLTAIGMLYSITGSLNMADLAITLQQINQPGLVTVISTLFLIAFGIKSAIFPFFFWLPASYHTPPIAVTTLFSGLMTKAGVYATIRVFTLMFTQQPDFTHNLILIISGLTMVVGVFGAVAQYDFRRLLSFHIISQIGYLMMGLGLFTVMSLTGTIFFMVHVIIAKSALFLVSGISNIICKMYDLKNLGSLYKGYPLLAFLFIIPALSLAGIPPLSGFWAKLALVQAGLEIQSYAITGVALFVSVFTLFSMTKIWAEAFWKDSPVLSAEGIAGEVEVLSSQTRRYATLLAPLIILSALTFIIGISAEPILQLAQDAATQLMNPEIYIQAVLGVAP